MASEMAQQLAFNARFRMHGHCSEPELEQMQDQHLAPVRECLEGLMIKTCWCHTRSDHSPSCLKSQEVWKSLEIK